MDQDSILQDTTQIQNKNDCKLFGGRIHKMQEVTG